MNTNALFEKIAKEHLFVGTLEARNRDDLDFPACNVRGIKKALQAAYEAGQKSNRTPVRVMRGEPAMMLLGTIETTYKALVAAFGEPMEGDGYKTEAVWCVDLTSDSSVQIYNYKNSRSYDKANPQIQDVHEWSVDGTQSDAIEWVRGQLGKETQKDTPTSEKLYVRFARKAFRLDEVIAAASDTSNPGSPVKIAETKALSTQEYDAFTNSLLQDHAWLAGKGGYLNLKHQVIEVTAPERQTLYVDPSGSSYGRYVGLRVSAPTCRYPDVRVYLLDRKGSTKSIIAQAHRAALKERVPKEDINAFLAEARDGTREQLLAACERWFFCI
jgi:hypothetical protein